MFGFPRGKAEFAMVYTDYLFINIIDNALFDEFCECK